MKRLLSCALIAALPAAALSLKDWEAASLQQQQDYLAECLIRLTNIVKKTDPALEQRISDYYTGLAAPYRYQEGKLDVLQRIGQLQGRAERGDRSVDLSKIQIEDIILQNTSAKFSLPAAVTAAAIGPPASAPPKPAAPAPTPARPAAPTPKPAEPAPPALRTIPTPERDPIGPGGFIVPPPVYNIADHKPEWIGKTMDVQGTVARATAPDVVRIFFREAPDGGFQVFTPLVEEMRARFGRDLSGLVGKTVRIHGEIEKFSGTQGGIRFTGMDQLTIVP